MKILDVTIVDPTLKDLSNGGSKSGPQLASLLEQEMVLFDNWMNKELEGGLTKFERAIIKTYLYHKIVGRIDDLVHNKTTTTP